MSLTVWESYHDLGTSHKRQVLKAQGVNILPKPDYKNGSILPTPEQKAQQVWIWWSSVKSKSFRRLQVFI